VELKHLTSEQLVAALTADTIQVPFLCIVHIFSSSLPWQHWFNIIQFSSSSHSHTKEGLIPLCYCDTQNMIQKMDTKTTHSSVFKRLWKAGGLCQKRKKKIAVQRNTKKQQFLW